MNKLLLDYLDKKNVKHRPIWLMRQAGRYLPEYMEIRQQYKDFLELCYNPEAASIITLQPIDRFDFDAAIIFSDILVIPDALGQEVIFSEGPHLKPITVKEASQFDFHKLNGRIENVYEAINLTKAKLALDKTLIGFSGAPWTLACYMLGKSSNEFRDIKLIAYEEAELVDQLIEGLTEIVIRHLANQIEAGVDVVQIFDSCAGILTEDLYEKYVITPTKRIVERLKVNYPSTKIIGFPRGSSSRYEKYLRTNVDVLSIDQNVELEWSIKTLSDRVILQGNIDPILLLCKDEEKLRGHLRSYLEKIDKHKVICNLGHGVTKETPIKNVEILCEMVRNY
jgi:uroporphyrinogen decarboxylase